jgi:hypothetical protein
MQLTGACRLCGSSSPCSCCPCLVQFLRVCLTVQKPTVRTYRIQKTLPQYCKSAFDFRLAEGPHALQDPDITRVGTPCRFVTQSLSTTNRHTSFATFDFANYIFVLCTLCQSCPSTASSFQYVRVYGSAHASFQLSLPTTHIERQYFT